MTSSIDASSLKEFGSTVSIAALRSAFALSEAVAGGDAEAIAAANKAFVDDLTGFAEDSQSDEGQSSIDKARERYASDDIEVDDYPLLSIGNDGTWVSAWVLVPNGGR